MSWRERLAEQRAEKNLEGSDGPLTKPTKGAFVSFVSTPDDHSESIAALPDPAVRAALLALADRLGVDRAAVVRIPSADLLLWASVPDDALPDYLRGLGDAATRQAGRVPPGDTAPILCARCGLVYVHPAIAAALPVVAGWPRALGCPWCSMRKAGSTIPRPRITCAGCRHFQPDAINPAAGVGGCARGHGTHYPMQRHGCGDFDLCP